jgi:hypothetical protein
MEKMTHIWQIPNTNSKLPSIYDFAENSPIKKYAEWESPHLVLPVPGNTGYGMEQASVEALWPSLTLPHHNVFLLGMGFTIEHNASNVQKFPFPIVTFHNLKLGGNRPLLVMAYLEFYLEMPQYCTGFAMLKFEFWH